MRSITIVFLYFFLICSASAWPLDLSINKAVVRSDDVSNFHIYQPGVNSLAVSVQFNDTTHDPFRYYDTEEEFEEQFAAEEIAAMEDPMDLRISFAPHSHGSTIIDTNKLRFDPVMEIAPKDLIDHGVFNTSLGGLPGVVTWWATSDSRDASYPTMRIVGLTADNGTEIGVESDMIPLTGTQIAHVLTAFNKSLQLIELHYLEP
jgi:hypothetical protein